MPTYSKEFLSASAYGTSIPILATGTSTTPIHTTPVSGAIDELWLYASNPIAQDVMLNILVGGNNFTSGAMFEGIIEAYAGNVLVCPAFIFAGDGVSGLSIAGNVSVPSGVNIFGYVNRIS